MYLPEELLILPRAGRGIKGDGEKKREQEFWRRDKQTTHYNVITERGSAPRVKSNNAESEEAAALQLFLLHRHSFYQTENQSQKSSLIKKKN